MRLFWRAILCTTFIMWGGVVHAAESWVVEAEAAKCILENIENYRAQTTRIIVIPVGRCPETDLFGDDVVEKQNSAVGPKIKTSQTDTKFDRFISYSKAEMDCLDITSISFDGETAFFPKKPDCAE